MSFINSKASAQINAKLTSVGRKLLAEGKLTYKYYVFGDSEIDYSFSPSVYNPVQNIILAPKDKNANIKYPIPALQNGDPFNALPAIGVVEKVVTNTAKTRGFFGITGNTVNLLTDSKHMVLGDLQVQISSLVGNKELQLKRSASYSTGDVVVGDYIYMGIRNGGMAALTGQTKGSINPNELVPYLTYKVEAIVSGSLSADNLVVRVDRNLPNFNGSNAGIFSKAYIFPYSSGDSINNFYGSASTLPYWSDNTLSFDSNCNIANDDVPVWNMTIVRTESLAGVNSTIYENFDAFNSNKYAGFKEYLNYTSFNKYQKSIGIIHYSNYSISNYYGELLASGTFVLNLPTVMWHKTTFTNGSGTADKLGLVLSAATDSKTLVVDPTPFNTASIPFSLPYNDLVDPYGNTVGKVFYTLKLAVVENEELIAAMSYKSNRSWTLPALTGTFTNASSDNLGLLSTTEEIHVTYMLGNNGLGYSTALPCQSYLILNRGGTSQNNVKVSFPLGQLGYMKSALNTGGGFSANKFYVLAQKVTIGAAPVPGNWKLLDFTTLINGYTSGNINPLNLEGTTFTIDANMYNNAGFFNLFNFLDIPTKSETSRLQFGDEVTFMGNVDTKIQANVYKSSFSFSAPSSQFNVSKNPTFVAQTNKSVYVSEVGIYDDTKRLVAVGKLSQPLEKRISDTLFIQLEIDF